MIVAQQKRKESIIEYILYMWQVEDLIRANGLNMSRIEESIVKKYGADGEKSKEIYDWWDNLTEMMRIEKKEERGHLQIVKSLTDDVYNFHLYLLTQPTEIPYQNSFQTAWPDLTVLASKIPGGDKIQHIELALTGVYNYFLLKLQNKTTLADTTNAIVRITRFLAILSQKYLEAERELLKKSETNDGGIFNKLKH